MNVLLLTDDMKIGGVPRHVVDLANGLSNRGLSVVVAATDGPLRARLRPNVDFISLPLLMETTGGKRLSGFVTSLMKLRRVVRNFGIDLIHSHKRYTDVLGRGIARLANIRHVSTCHNTFSNHKWISPFGDLTIACSDSMQRMLTDHFHLRSPSLRRIYNGIEPLKKFSTREISEARMFLSLPSKVKIVTSVGHLTPAKNHAALLEAIYSLNSQSTLPDVLWVIVGQGPEKPILHTLVKRYGLERLVRFLASDADVERLMNISEFLVLPSIREGLPYVLLEAASIEKPHVATDVGGVSEFILHGETGLLVPPQNVRALADAIGFLLQHPQEVRRLGLNARARCEQQHGMDRFVDETISVYREALAK